MEDPDIKMHTDVPLSRCERRLLKKITQKREIGYRLDLCAVKNYRDANILANLIVMDIDRMLRPYGITVRWVNPKSEGKIDKGEGRVAIQVLWHRRMCELIERVQLWLPGLFNEVQNLDRHSMVKRDRAS